MFYFQNTSHFYWSDQSPYAFQSWYSSVLNQAGYVIKLRLKRGIYGEYNSRKIAEFNPLNEVLQPSGNPNHTCGIIDFRGGHQNSWKKYPCTAPIGLNASYVCEIRITPNQSSDTNLQDTNMVINRQYAECPANTTTIGSTCILVISRVNNMKKVEEKGQFCQVGNLYRMPDFINTKPPETWMKKETFLVETLHLIFHRCPSVIDFTMIDEY